ncbi:MAG: GNAT family N-acetyltransferase [Candidatus Cloacimonetes bacterium]|nr:GNAT family N-acetyltransferase [Candidatus Cloacimonadota bacterium]
MSNIRHITKLNPKLYSDLIELWLSTGISNPERNDSFEAVEYSLEHGGLMLVSISQDVLQGSAWLTHDFRRLYIHHMAVQPNLQNTGIGASLVEEALSIAKKLGYQAKLEVHADNPAALHLYQKCGFTELNGYIVMIKRN